jgi:hypothetical protein
MRCALRQRQQTQALQPAPNALGSRDSRVSFAARRLTWVTSAGRRRAERARVKGFGRVQFSRVLADWDPTVCQMLLKNACAALNPGHIRRMHRRHAVRRIDSPLAARRTKANGPEALANTGRSTSSPLSAADHESSSLVSPKTRSRARPVCHSERARQIRDLAA